MERTRNELSFLALLTSAALATAGCGGAEAGTSPTSDTGSNKMMAEVAGAGGTALVTPTVCTSPVQLYNTSAPTAVVGTGTPASCTEADLRAKVALGGVITFNCGPDPVTIALSQTLRPHLTRDTIIDGNGKVTLDARQRARHFTIERQSWQSSTTKFVVQRLTIINGKAPSGEYFPPLPNPKCAYGYKEGSGGAIFARDGVVHIIDSVFRDNQAALLGPDVGGGAVYVLGNKELVISGSRFTNNRAANGGAVGMLFANPKIFNSVFENNTAEGVGQNVQLPASEGCPVFGHDGQGGAGGLGGGIYFDGMNDDGFVYTICGSTFKNNRANELSGALFRTPNVAVRNMAIDRSTFDGNTAKMGAVSFIMENNLKVRDSTFMNNKAGADISGNPTWGIFGGLWVYKGSLEIVNSTFFNNAPDGLALEDASGTLTNVTVSKSKLSGSLTVNNSLFTETECGTTFAGQYNVQWPIAQACAQGTKFVNPTLGAVGNNGGPTPTLLPGNPSAVRWVGKNCPSTDQRGRTRSTTACSAGSVEP